ncbi:MAG: flagellar biosynthesis anti-sigma factor FlgM [Deltaproteobacteria bacterium]|nr:flagellar biosynthesis anti-sigma factor FlgM [Deltaproteobacteria bacterium]
MNVLHIKDVNAPLIREYRRKESVPIASDKGADPAAMRPQKRTDFSTAVVEIREAEVKASKLSDARNEKLLDIKSQVQRGTYNVSGERIARKMMRESIFRHFGFDLRVKNCMVRHFPYEPGFNTVEKSPRRDGIIPGCFNGTFNLLIRSKK